MQSDLHTPALAAFEARVAVHRERLLRHPIYDQLTSLQAVKRFMKFHAFAVLDFMSLLKSLQRSLTCVDVPWLPAPDAQLSRLINEIVLVEECDEVGEGAYLSHFEIYLRAMDEIGADTAPILDFVSRVRESPDFAVLLVGLARQGGAFDFMRVTFELAGGEPHEVAAAFLFGREDIIPEMFSRVLKGLDSFQSQGLRFFRHYLERHIQVDGEAHGPLARRMLVALCGESSDKWQEAEEAALAAIEARINLWSFIATVLPAADRQLSEWRPSLHGGAVTR